jgi:tetratricopeptide (TPR) repeat protein
MIALTRRASVAATLGLVATATAASPTFAQAADDRTKARADAVSESNALRTMRHFQLALDTVLPYANDNDFDVFVAIGQAIEGWTTPLDRLRAVEWYDRAIALEPDNKNGYVRRAGAYGDAGYRHFEERLDDRRQVVDLAEAASPTKTAAAGDYSSLAGAEGSFMVPRGGGTVDQARRELVLQLRTKAIDVDETIGRLLDRAEFINSNFKNQSMGRGDVERAWYQVKRLDQSVPANWYELAQFSRRVAALPRGMTLAGATITVDGISSQYRPSVAQLRNQAIENYSQYIDAFEGSGRDYATFGSGIGAYENRRVVFNSLGGTFHREAIKDLEVLLEINPRNANYWRNTALHLDALDERTAARPYYEKYLELNGPEDLGNVGATRARLAEK